MSYDIKRVLCDFDDALTNRSSGRLLALVQWDGAEPVLDIREWTMEDGELVPGEGLTFDLVNAARLSIALTDEIVKAAVEGRTI